MKPKTRDNLIYLAVGLGIAALGVADFFYADSHGREPWLPSSFAFRIVGSTIIVGYFVGREVRKVSAKLAEVVLCVVVAEVLQLAISFGFRQYVDRLSGMSYVGLATLGTVFIVKLATWGVSRVGAAGSG